MGNGTTNIKARDTTARIQARYGTTDDKNGNEIRQERSGTLRRSHYGETGSCKGGFVKTFEAISAERAAKANGSSEPIAKTDRRRAIYSSAVVSFGAARRDLVSQGL